MKLQMLILDDDPGIRQDLADFFVKQGARVFEAGRPSTALKLLEQQEFDIVILDLKLPEMDGIEVLKRIKAEWPAIEIIMITGHGDTRNIVEAMRLGALDFFTKPFAVLTFRLQLNARKIFSLAAAFENGGPYVRADAQRVAAPVASSADRRKSGAENILTLMSNGAN